GVFTGRGPAVAGGHRIDEHQIGHVEERIAVVDQPVGRRRRHAFRLQLHAARTEGSEMQPDGRRAGTAVVGEGDGALGAILDALPRVGDEEDAGPRLPLFLPQHQRAGRGGVADLLAADDRLVLGGDEPVLYFQRVVFVPVILAVLSQARGWLSFLRGRGEPAKEDEGNGQPEDSVAHQRHPFHFAGGLSLKERRRWWHQGCIYAWTCRSGGWTRILKWRA